MKSTASYFTLFVFERSVIPVGREISNNRKKTSNNQ